MKTPRLLPAATAIFVLGAALATVAICARRLESRHVHALAPQMFAQKNQGAALQRAAFRQPDLLPIYGSSDLNLPNRYHASALFRDYPTGFTIFPVGNPGSTSLIWLQALAAIGSDLRGRKVALSFSARPFFDEAVDSHAYAANFSPLQASALVFSTRLDFAVKQGAARRMLQYPATLADYPLLEFALERLAGDSLSDRALYYASVPLGNLYGWVLRLQDHWETLVFLRAQLGIGPVLRRGAQLDWTGLLAAAEQESRRQADNNPFGFENELWAARAAEISRQKGMYQSEASLQVLQRSAEWIDLDLLLRAIGDLGGEALLLSIPMNGAYFDFLGVPSAARHTYYERLRELAKVHGVSVLDFADHDSDKFFTVDPSFHLSGRGWVYYARALDAFFHDRKPADL